MLPADSRVNVGGVLLFAALCVALFLSNNVLADTSLLPKWFGLGVVSALGASLLLFQKRMELSRLLMLGLFSYLISLLPGLFVSSFSPEAVYFTVRECSWIFFLLVFAASLRPNSSLKNLLVLLSAAGAVAALWALKEWLGQLEGITITHQATYHVKAGFEHRNILVEWLGLLLPASIACSMQLKGVQRWLHAGIAFLMTAMLVLLLGRTGWISLGIVVLVFLIAERKSLSGKFRWIHLLPIALILGCLLATVDELYTIGHHFETAFDTTSGTTRDRMLLLSRSWMLFSQNWLLGIGWGAWPVSIMPFDQFEMLTESGKLFYQRPHNDVLLLLSEGGVFPALTFLLLLFGALRLTFRMPPSTDRTWLLSSLLVYVFITLIAFPLERMEHRILLAVFLVAAYQSKAPHRLLSGRYMVVAMVGLASCLSRFHDRLQSERALAQASKAYDEGRWEETLEYLKDADRAFLAIDASSLPVDWYRGASLLNLGSLEVGCNAFRNAAAINPHHPEVQNSLGVCAYRHGNSKAAEYHFYQAVRYTPSFSDAWVNIALLQRAKGQDEEAFESLNHADPTTEDLHYRQLAMKLAVQRIDAMVSDYDERKLKLTIIAIRNTPHWALDVFQKSVTNCIPFEEQVLIDAFYYMFSYCGEGADCDEIRAMKQHYIPTREILMDNGRVE